MPRNIAIGSIQGFNRMRNSDKLIVLNEGFVKTLWLVEQEGVPLERIVSVVRLRDIQI